MANQDLIDWFRSGFEDRMIVLSESEERTSIATQRCVTNPGPASLAAATAAADAFATAATDAAAWLAAHPAPHESVNTPFTQAFAAYLEAAEILVEMGRQPTIELGNRAAAAVARAKRANYEGAFAYARLVLE